MRHLKIYRAIRLIQREGSIRKAAEVLSVSPSALNRQIQGFEEELAVDVFERIPGGVRLSSAGELLLDMIDRHLTEFDDMQTQLKNLRDGLAGTLRLSFGSDVNAGLLPNAVAEFERDYPGVSVEIFTDDTTAALHRRTVDFAILTNPVTDDAVEVLYSHTALLTAWRHGSAPGEAVNVGLWDIVGARMLVPPSGTGTRAAIGHMLRRHRLAEGVTTTLTAAQLASHPVPGPAFSIFPEPARDAEGARWPAERLPVSLGQIQITVLRPTRAPLTRSAQTFLTLLQRRLDETTPRRDADRPDNA